MEIYLFQKTPISSALFACPRKMDKMDKKKDKTEERVLR